MDPKTTYDATLDELRTIIDDLQTIIDDTQHDPACPLAAMLWRLRTLYRQATSEDPWPEERR